MRRVRRRGRSFVPISPEKERRTRGVARLFRDVDERKSTFLGFFVKVAAHGALYRSSRKVRTHPDSSVTRGSGARSDLRRPLGQI